MAIAWKCLKCETMVTQKTCPGCGGEQSVEAPQVPATVAAEPEPVEDHWSPLDYCSWTTRDRETGVVRPCLMLATTWDQPYMTRDKNGKHVREGYCHWHAMCRETKGLAHNLSRYKAFVEDLQKHKVCTQFSHHPPEYSFPALQGIERLLHERILVTPCGAGACWVPATLEAHYLKLDEERRAAEGKVIEVEVELIPQDELRGMVKKLTEQMGLSF